MFHRQHKLQFSPFFKLENKSRIQNVHFRSHFDDIRVKFGIYMINCILFRKFHQCKCKEFPEMAFLFHPMIAKNMRGWPEIHITKGLLVLVWRYCASCGPIGSPCCVHVIVVTQAKFNTCIASNSNMNYYKIGTMSSEISCEMGLVDQIDGARKIKAHIRSRQIHYS